MPGKDPTRTVGAHLENIALSYLQGRGLQLVCRNFQCKLGEIDLIMQDGQTLVFVEVRYRRSERYGLAVETVDWRKQRKLIRTAQVYLNLRRLSQSRPCRFDILGITLRGEKSEYHFDWIPNAFSNEMV